MFVVSHKQICTQTVSTLLTSAHAWCFQKHVSQETLPSPNAQPPPPLPKDRPIAVYTDIGVGWVKGGREGVGQVRWGRGGVRVG